MKQLLLLILIGLAIFQVTGSAQTASATWALTANGTPVTVGNVVANTIDTSATSTNIVGFLGHTFADTNFTGLILGASGIKSWPADSTKTTANSSFSGLSNGVQRYIQFTIAPTSGNVLTVDNISLSLTESGTATNINTAIGYSTDGVNFTAVNGSGITGNALPANTAQIFSAIPAVTINSSQTLTVRVVLWRKANSVASASSVYLKNVVLSGSNSSSTPAASTTWTLTKDGTPAIVGSISASTIDTATSSNITGFAGHTFADTSYKGLIVGATGPTNWNGESGYAPTSDFTGVTNDTVTSTRYMQFKVSPTGNKELTVNKISIQLTESGTTTNIMAVAAYSSDGINFTAFNSKGTAGDSLPANTSKIISATPSLVVNASGAVTVRLLLWRKASSAAAKSSVYVGPVVISGTTNIVGAVSAEKASVKDFDLSQNYPNPFNPTTVISYRLAADSKVNLTVYNALGSEVSTLVNETQNSGSHSVSFNATNLSSGTYFYRLQAGGLVKAGKMILIK